MGEGWSGKATTGKGLAVLTVACSNGAAGIEAESALAVGVVDEALKDAN